MSERFYDSMLRGLTPRFPKGLTNKIKTLATPVCYTPHTRFSFSTMAEAPKSNWYDAFPPPRHTAPLLPREVALSSLSSPELLLVDVRRTDFEGGTIKGSLNLPAHSFFMNRRVLYNLCKRAGVKQIAFYCGEWYLLAS
jgi:hypothetical protein